MNVRRSNAEIGPANRGCGQIRDGDRIHQPEHQASDLRLVEDIEQPSPKPFHFTASFMAPGIVPYSGQRSHEVRRS